MTSAPNFDDDDDDNDDYNNNNNNNSREFRCWCSATTLYCYTTPFQPL